jgi:serine/threonine protein kinase
MGSSFVVDRRYEILDIMGTGAYGVVVSAIDTQTQRRVAIKKIEKAFEHPVYSKRTLRELKIMRLMRHDNILKLLTIQLPTSLDEFNDLYIFTELLETDLSSIIKSSQPLTAEHTQFFLYQLLRGLKYLHSANILHRDLKPRNILVNTNCDLKICDFGLSRAELVGLEVSSGSMSDYVATRWYRAPELILTYKKYTKALDVWSVGVIFGELLKRKPILPGNDSQEQLELIFSLIGSPSVEEIERVPNPRAREQLRRMPRRRSRPFEQVFSDADPQAVDLLRTMLVFDPSRRSTVEQALAHPYFAGLHFEDDEPSCPPVSRFDFDFERSQPSINDLKLLIYEEILLHHSPTRQSAYREAKIKFEAEMSGNSRVGSGSSEDELS